VVVIMYMREPEGELKSAVASPILWAGIALALAGTIYLGIMPGDILEAARLSATTLL
jgi:hypothetical protein